ncbi:SOS response-associated peptidase [Ancylothrix sp. C2]|uniref:SOS response-associated peptidase n=1 Tax=Ancylothrix sp. D3o TaxID=2953691 RepID=UPI0021BAE830|nr:SOS response-associated peptidase [Ancylothrix sp. D3o]MCT7949933.1 SOS response-associated peptidase [Ancylothrix sp. D3o]
MCGRYTLTRLAEDVGRIVQASINSNLKPRYNIAPTQPVATILQPKSGKERELRILHWGLIPSWAKDESMSARMINARAETVAEKPSFRSAFKRRRCLVVADGFYEWQTQGKKKQPFYFKLKNGEIFGFAGLWEHWEKDGNVVESCTIITTNANDLMQPIHDRMPVILHPKDYDLWLDPDQEKVDVLQGLLQPYSQEEMTAYPVSTIVNKPANDSPECVEPVAV